MFNPFERKRLKDILLDRTKRRYSNEEKEALIDGIINCVVARSYSR